MPIELFADRALTSFAANGGQVTSDATTFLVSSGTQYGSGWALFPVPTAGQQFRIIAGTEIMIVTAVNTSTQTWTVTRGAEGTTRAAHNDGDAIVLILTAYQMGLLGAGANGVTSTAANYLATATDDVILVTAASKTVTLPAASSAGADRKYTVKNSGSGGTTTVASAGGTIDGASTYTGLSLAYASARFVSDGTNWYTLATPGTGGGGGSLGSATPQPLGIAAVGVSASASHEDHVHVLPTAAEVCAIPEADRGAASGVATLGSTGVVPFAQRIRAWRTVTANATLTTADEGVVVNAASVTLTLPAPATMAGRTILIKNGPSGATTTVSGTIDGGTSFTGLTAAMASATVECDGTSYWVF